MADDAVFRALANPTRRSILDRLRPGPLTTGQLVAAHPDLSRFAVMQHLGVLVDAGLVVARRRGRERFNHLDAVPLRRVYERWVGRIAGASAAELLALESHIERGSPMSELRVVRVENEIRFRATPERVFAAMTTETLQWFPHTYGEERVVGIVTESRVGGVVKEDWGDGRGHVYSIIQQWDPPRTMTTRGWLGPGVTLDTVTTVEADGDEAVLRVSKVAVGPLTEDEAKGIRRYGGLDNFEQALRTWVER
jgi:DNA-binding transcriptional ArsR family regulator